MTQDKCQKYHSQLIYALRYYFDTLLRYNPPPQSYGMGYTCTLGLLDHSQLVKGVATPGNFRPELQLGRRDSYFFVPAALLSIFTLLSVPSFSVSLSYFNRILFSRACVRGKTRAWVYISYSYTEWNFLFLRGEIFLALTEASPVKN